MTRNSRVLMLLLVLAAAGGYWVQHGQSQVPPKHYHFVRGTVIALLEGAFSNNAAGAGSREIALPAARVFLVRSTDLTHPLTSVRSDLSGRFALKTLEDGPLTVCVEADGFQRNCQTKEFRFVDAKPQLLGKVRIAPVRGDGLIPLFGTVALRDGKPARVFAPHMGINAFPRVTLEAGTLKRSAFVNNFGEYVFGGILAKANIKLRAQVEKESREYDLLAEATPPGTTQRYDFVFSNSSPRLRAMAAQVGGQRVQAVATGAQVIIRATVDDPDSDPLTYRWTLPDGTMTGPSPQPTLTMTAPTRRGNYGVGVLVTDDHGGVVHSSYQLTVTDGGVAFNGVVVDPAGTPINGAQVDVNGRLVNTNNRGYFNLEVPIQSKYVLTIRKSGVDTANQPGYGTASFVYPNSVLGGRWTLRPAQVFTVDPTKPIKVQHRRTEKDCVGSDGIAWNNYIQPGLIDWQDGRGNSLRLDDVGRRIPKDVLQAELVVSRLSPGIARVLASQAKIGSQVDDRTLPCRPGIQVEIPANALEDMATKAAPNGMVRISVSAIDLNNATHMPGDYSVSDSTGKAIGMESYGAGSIEIGAGGRRYNLKSTATANVTIPVDGTQIAGNATPPPTIPFLYYDERTGMWKQDGVATLTGTGATAAYVKKVAHFSTMNADILKSGQSCLAVEVDPGATFSPTFDVEVTLSPSKPNPTVIQKRVLSVDSNKSNVIYNLPNDTNVVLVPVIPGVRPDGSNGNVPAGVFVVNSGGPMLSGTNPPSPNADGTYYAESGGNPTGPCAARVTLTNLATPTIDPQFEFLQGLYFESSNLTELDGSDPAVSQAIQNAVEGNPADPTIPGYYSHADPRSFRITLNQFKSKNKFGQALTANEAEFDAQYANSGDLGFGRDMHCRRNVGGDGAFDLACFVTNYGQPPLNLPDQNDADNVLNGTPPDATVAMEYSRVENPPTSANEFPDNDRAVKFFVYNTNQPDAPRLIKADLDGFGARPVPQLCMICHGGQAASEAADAGNPNGPKKGAFVLRTDIVSMNSQFLPFDQHFFTMPAAKPNQNKSFKNLNIEIVRKVAQGIGALGQPTRDIIDAWYAGNSPIQIDGAVITNWDAANPNSDDNRLYKDVFARACRTCHNAGPFTAPPYQDKNDFRADISTVQTRVCGQRVMPHALRTNQIFWNSLTPNMPAFLQLYGQTLPGWSPTGADQCGTFIGGGTIPSVFTNKIYPILTNRCAGCHTHTGNANWHFGDGADIAYNELLNAAPNVGGKYIVPNNSGASVLFQRISQANPGRMPQGGPDLATVDLDNDGTKDLGEFLKWINLGAPK